MKVSLYISWKLKVLSLFAIVLVIQTHSYLLNMQNYVAFSYFQDFISGYLGRVFQPLFFVISGYLFFVNFRPTCNSFIQKYISRFRTLVIPYVFWNIMFFLFIIGLKSLPFIGRYVNGDFTYLMSMNCLEQFDCFFVQPIAFHLWFIRDLILIICFTPLIWLLNKHVPYLFIPLLVIGDLLGIAYIGSAVPFSIGALFAIKNVNIDKIAIREKYLFGLGGASLVIGIVHTCFLSFSNYTYYLCWPLFLFIWFGYDYLYSVKKWHFSFLSKFVGYTFFIYVFHEPTLNIFKKIFPIIGGNSEWVIWLCYLTSPLLTFSLCFSIGFLLNKYCLTFYKVIVGNRL